MTNPFDVKYERNNSQIIKPKERIIVALDVETSDQARKIIDEISDDVGAFKIGLQLFTSAGASFVRETVEK